MSEPFRLLRGTAPLLVSVPHDGRDVPEAIRRRFSEEARALPDTDWHVAQLYDFAPELGASMLVATQSRYVIDLNRPPDDASLYSGANNTALVPTTTFAQQAIYAPGDEPDERELSERRRVYWQPYHDALAGELERLRREHGAVVLFDAHSIRSRVPRFFEGTLPDLNLGSDGGRSAHSAIEQRALSVLRSAARYSSVLNGRFRGGYITRHHGNPEEGTHALQLELAQKNYMFEDPPYEYSPELAAPLREVLRELLSALIEQVKAL